MLKFENSFWDNPGAGHQPRYERGPQCLYEKLEQGSAECDELLSFFRERAAIEEAYASNLRKLAERQLSPKGFDRDEGATLKTAYRGLIAECAAMAAAHSDLAIELQSSVIMPLRNFCSEHRARVRASWKIIDDTIRRASTELGQVDRNHRVYTQKAAAAEQMRLNESPSGLQPGASPAEFEVKPRLSMAVLSSEASAAAAVAAANANTSSNASNDVASSHADTETEAELAAQRQLLSARNMGSVRSPMLPVSGGLDVATIMLGNVGLTRHEFHVMLQRMQKEVPQHDVKFGILGTFKGLISGESLAGWWCTNYPTVVRNEADAILVGQSMIDQGYLRLMGRGSQFQSRSNAYYQWKKPALEFQSDDEYDSDDEPLGRRSVHLGRATMTYERAQREADQASQIYRDSVIHAELVRTDLEEQLINYLDTMEVWELNRLINIKTTLGEYARIHKLPVRAELAIGDRLEVYEESLKPQQDIQWTIEHYGTGRFTPRPIIFRPFGLSPAEYQIFGVPLDEQLLVSHKDIPLLPAKALSLIRKESMDLAHEDRYKIWTTRALLRNIHDMRNMVNRGSRVTLKALRRFDLHVVANVLVLYFLELPTPLCPEELQGPLRALYSSTSEKSTAETLETIRNLLSGVSYAHIKTLQTLFYTLSEQAKGDEDVQARKTFISEVSQRLGPVILRGKDIVGVSVSRVPQIFAADLIEHYDELLAGIDTQRPFKPNARPAKSEAANEDSQLSRGLEHTRFSGTSPTMPISADTVVDAAVAATSMVKSSLGTAVTPRASLDVPANNASKRSSAMSARSSSNANDAGISNNRASTSSNGNGSTQQALTPAASETQKTHTTTPFDDDERFVNNILNETNDSDIAAGNGDNIEFFLNDEESDGTDYDDDDDNSDDNDDNGDASSAKSQDQK
ncbi:Rho-GTPase-activating protein 8 [Coemansia asiatica]|uniref:Rho-GTPase-activating protein 8 n=1 Tax=Coemansia asiatica TaxID=1052880 RepID=A0A9W7XIR9_9FUNG|nr:Rho-GTPase-activating protein 8 [Coemansia asiatica]